MNYTKIPELGSILKISNDNSFYFGTVIGKNIKTDAYLIYTDKVYSTRFFKLSYVKDLIFKSPEMYVLDLVKINSLDDNQNVSWVFINEIISHYNKSHQMNAGELCSKCKMFFSWVEPNQEDFTYICYNCRRE